MADSTVYGHDDQASAAGNPKHAAQQPTNGAIACLQHDQVHAYSVLRKERVDNTPLLFPSHPICDVGYPCFGELATFT